MTSSPTTDDAFERFFADEYAPTVRPAHLLTGSNAHRGPRTGRVRPRAAATEVGRTIADLGPTGTSIVVDTDGAAGPVSLRAWAADSTMFGEVPASGRWGLVDFDSFLAQYAAAIDDDVTVPPLVGLTEPQVRNALERASLAGNVTYVDVPAGDDRDGTVIEQDLVPGSAVDPGTPVALTVAVATP